MTHNPHDPAARPWTVDDLDRCVHGRHSIDHCYDCPHGQSTGNLFLAPADRDLPRGQHVRVGTRYDGSPITVAPLRRLRPTSPPPPLPPPPTEE